MPTSGLNQMTAYYHGGETIDQLDNRPYGRCSGREANAKLGCTFERRNLFTVSPIHRVDDGGRGPTRVLAARRSIKKILACPPA